MLAPQYSPSLAMVGQRLREAPWTVAMRYAWATFLACMALKWILPAAWVHALHPLLKAAPLFPFLAKDLSHLPDARARACRAPAARLAGAVPGLAGA